MLPEWRCENFYVNMLIQANLLSGYHGAGRYPAEHERFQSRAQRTHDHQVRQRVAENHTRTSELNPGGKRFVPNSRIQQLVLR